MMVTKKKPVNEVYFVLYAEWFEPNPQVGLQSQANQSMIRVGNNEWIDKSITDFIFTVRAEGTRPGLVVRWAMPISKEEYEQARDTVIRLQSGTEGPASEGA